MKMCNYLILMIVVLSSCCFHKLLDDRSSNEEMVRNLQNVTHFPDDYFFPKGDSVCEEILKGGKEIAPLLIREIDNDSQANYRYADAIQYKVGDIAIHLLDQLYADSELPLRELMEEEFNLKDKNAYPLYLTLYHEIFSLNSERENLKNRKRFKKVMLKWYKEKNQ